MNIKEFLIDNYIWIIVVIVLLIITIIGFLADKKKGKDPKVGAPQPSPAPNNTAPAGPINYQPVAPNQNVQPLAPTNVGQITNNAMAPNAVPNQNVNMNAAPMAPVSVEPINSVNANPEPMYQPLSEQKPTFGPTQNNMAIPPVPPVAPMPLNNATPVANATLEPVAAIPNQQPVYAPLGPAPIPTPVSPVPPVAPIPNPVGPNPNPAPMAESIPATTTPQPVSFVYGVQQGNQNNNGM